MSRTYKLTLEAENDLLGIWLFGADRWGEIRADRYQDDLHDSFQRVVNSTIQTRQMEDVKAVSYYPHQRHFVFFTEHADSIVILAVLHQSMDLPAQLANRLNR